MRRRAIVVNGIGVTRSQFLEPEKSVKIKEKSGGYSIRDWVPNRINQDGQLELQIPGANWSGPKTDVNRRLREGVKPTTNTDAYAKKHDITYYNVARDLAMGKISKADAEAKLRSSDERLVRGAIESGRGSLNPLERFHSAVTATGIVGKLAAEDLGLMNKLKFANANASGMSELPAPYNTEGGKSKKKPAKKPNLIKGLLKRYKITAKSTKPKTAKHPK